jgi:hypothetical protein
MMREKPSFAAAGHLGNAMGIAQGIGLFSWIDAGSSSAF